MTENDDDAFDLSPEEWLIESHNMVLAAFDDLRCAIDGVTADGAPFVPDATYIYTAFSRPGRQQHGCASFSAPDYRSCLGV